MQLNKVGIGLIAFFGLGGLAMAVIPFALGVPFEVAGILASIGVIWILVTLGLLAYARHQQRKAAHNDWIFQSGIKGSATILEVGNSHTTVNEMPLIKLKLELDLPGVGRSEVSRRELMPVFAANRMQQGLVLPAYANPKDRGEFILVW